MKKINREEYEILKSLDEKWKWIARNEDRCLYALTEKPVRKYDPSLYWDTETGEPYAALELFDEIHLFQFIQWEDEEPYNIKKLIKEYEDSKEYKDSLVIEYFMDKAKESEETEVKKNKEWLEDEVGNIVSEYQRENIFANFTRHMIYDIKDAIIQLNEPETLSQDWIEEHTWNNHYIGRPFVYVDDLQNAIVPKHEEVDRAYKDGYEKGKEHTFYKGYLEGLTDKERKPETVSDVVANFYEACERLQGVMSMEVEELEE